MIGSNQAFHIDKSAIEARLRAPGVLDRFALAGVDIRALLAPVLANRATYYDLSFDRSALLDINTDLDPRDEFELGVR